MLNFLKLTLNDIEKIKPYFIYSLSRTCDNTVGGTFMWRDFFTTEYAVFDDTVIFKVKYFNGTTAFSFPLGKNPAESIKEIYRYCVSEGIPTVFCTAAQEDVEIYKSIFNIKIFQETNWSDYIYRAQDLISLPGRKYGGQRNHINYFKRTYADYIFEELNNGNIRAAYEFYGKSSLIDSKNTDIFREEQKKVFEVLENYEKYGMLGGLLRAGGSVVAFSIGEIIRDTLFVHVEKADPDCRGAYQMIVNEFAKHYASDGVEFINREEDVGDEGLRISKMSYHPCDIIPKYTVAVQ